MTMHCKCMSTSVCDMHISAGLSPRMFSSLSSAEKADANFKVSLAWMIQVLLDDGQVRGGETDDGQQNLPIRV